MTSRHRNARLPITLAATAMLLAAPLTVRAGQSVQRPRNYVEDQAGVLDAATASRLNAMLAELEQKTTAQMIVLTVQTTSGVPIDDFALALAEKWQLGQKGKDNGVLIVVAVRDRKYWITVGYGLEPVLPDGFCGSVGRKHFVPNFRRGDYAGGIYAGTRTLVERVARSANVELASLAGAAPQPRPARDRPRDRSSGSPACGIAAFVLLIVILSLLGSAGRRRRAYRTWGGIDVPWWGWLLIFSQLSGRRRRGGDWFSGGGGFGGFGGGGFGGGGFGGGGGGGFGGGGAGGGW